MELIHSQMLRMSWVARYMRSWQCNEGAALELIVGPSWVLRFVWVWGSKLIHSLILRMSWVARYGSIHKWRWLESIKPVRSCQCNKISGARRVLGGFIKLTMGNLTEQRCCRYKVMYNCKEKGKKKSVAVIGEKLSLCSHASKIEKYHHYYKTIKTGQNIGRTACVPSDRPDLCARVFKLKLA